VPAITTPAAVQKTNPVSAQKTTPAQAVKVVPKITYVLARGMENNQVLRLQQILARYPEIYPEGQITGYFGLATERALKAFQRKNGLEPVGFTGPKTRVLLNR
jgi:peptidoglycan hydrolase-like protein with peptidoglycan-binding domain